jgi:hypothetical protein
MYIVWWYPLTTPQSPKAMQNCSPTPRVAGPLNREGAGFEIDWYWNLIEESAGPLLQPLQLQEEIYKDIQF